MEAWLATGAKLAGLLLILLGGAGFIISGFRHADQTVLGTGVLLIGSGHGAELIATLRRPPSGDEGAAP